MSKVLNGLSGLSYCDNKSNNKNEQWCPYNKQDKVVAWH